MMLEDGLVWVDLEMTGLDPDRDVVIEIATIVTDAHLNVIAEGPVLALHQGDAVLATMDEWNTRQHGQSAAKAGPKKAPSNAPASNMDFTRTKLPRTGGLTPPRGFTPAPANGHLAVDSA